MDASANFKDKIIKRWPMHANKPIAAIIDHWLKVGDTQTKGMNVVAIMAPTTPVNNKVNNGLSELLSLRVIIR